MLYVSGNVVCFEATEQKKWFCGVVSCGFVLFSGFVGLWCILFPKIIENIDAEITEGITIHNVPAGRGFHWGKNIDVTLSFVDPPSQYLEAIQILDLSIFSTIFGIIWGL